MRIDARLNDREQLLGVVAVVVHPLLQQILDSECADLRMLAAVLEVRGCQRLDQRDAVVPQAHELHPQALTHARAVVALAGHGLLVPGRQRLRGTGPCQRAEASVGDHVADPAGESAPLRFDQMTHALVHAPLVRRRMPRRALVTERRHLALDERACRFQERGDLSRRERGGHGRRYYGAVRLMLAIAVALIALVVAALSGAIDVQAHDFVAIYAAARLVALGRGPEILDPNAILQMEHAAQPARDLLLPWVHPPAVALLLAPLGALPILPAFAVMTALGTAALAIAAYRLALLASAEQRHRLYPFALFAPTSTIALAQGQTTPEVLLLVASAIGARPFVAGLLLGLTAIRPQTLPLFGIAALGDRARLAGFATGVGVVAALSLLVVGPGGVGQYASQLVTAGSWAATGEYGVGTAIGWIGPALALGIPLVGVALAVLSLVVGAALVLRGPLRVEQAAVWSLLASPHTLLHDGVLAYPAIAVCARSTRRTVLLVGGGLAAALLHQWGAPVGPFYLAGVAILTNVEAARARATSAAARTGEG